MKLFNTTGVVIKEIPTGESDKILTLLVGELGKITVYSKGSKRNGSRFIGSSQLLTYSNFSLFKGRSMHHINSADLIESFFNLRSDIIRLSYASFMCEMLNDSIYENQPSYGILRLFLNCLYFLANTEKSPELVILIFQLRLLRELGYHPNLNNCALCSSEDLFTFSYTHNGFLCYNCQYHDKFTHFLSRNAMEVYGIISSSPLSNALKMHVAPEVSKELLKFSNQLISKTFEKKYSNLDFIKRFSL
jgi:DNA repair protein RecO (recombination protein O)